MKTAQDYSTSHNISVLIIGSPGTGKTTLCLGWPGIYMADCDGLMSGAVRRLRKAKPDFAFHYDTINTTDAGKPVPLNMRWERLQACVKAAFAAPAVQTVAVDGMTSINEYLQDAIKNRTNLDVGRSLSQAEWGAFGVRLSGFLLDCLERASASRKAFLLTAHDRYDKDEMSGVLVYTPNVMGNTRFTLAGLFSDCWYCQVKEKKDQPVYTIRTRGNARINFLKTSLDLPIELEFKWQTVADQLK